MQHQYHRLLAYHGGAVLLGKKPAALFPVDSLDALNALAIITAQCGLGLLPLRVTDGRPLLLVYRQQQLEAALSQRLARRVLDQLGYPAAGRPEAMLAHLKARLGAGDGFPHEVGFFLGYPPADVVGFMLYGGKRCKHCGMWKVYSSVENAKRLSAEYTACSQLSCRHVAMGGDFGFLRTPVQAAAHSR